jgi:hypothetical protein
MKPKKTILSCFATVLAGLALTGSVSQAQPTNITYAPTGTNTSISSFDGHWDKFDGGAGIANPSFDATKDAAGDPTSGSVYLQGLFTGGGNYFRYAVTRGYWWGDTAGTTVDGTQYKSIQFDYLDPLPKPDHADRFSQSQ